TGACRRWFATPWATGIPGRTRRTCSTSRPSTPRSSTRRPPRATSSRWPSGDGRVVHAGHGRVGGPAGGGDGVSLRGRQLTPRVPPSRSRGRGTAACRRMAAAGHNVGVTATTHPAAGGGSGTVVGVPGRADVEQAAAWLSGRTVATPVLRSPALDRLAGARLWLKAE